MKKRLLHLTKKVLQHELVQGSSYLFIGTFLASILAFFFNLLVVRKLTPAHYGEYASLISLFSLAIVPAGSITTVVVKFATDYFSNNQLGKAKQLYKHLSIALIGFCFIILSISFIFSGVIENFLHIHDTILIFWIGLIVCLSYIGIANTAYLQSLFRFGYIALMTFVAALCKLVGGYFLLSLSPSLNNIFLAIFLSGLFSFIISFPPLKILFRKNTDKSSVSIKEITFYALPASLALIALSSFTSTDVILAKHFFSASQAGIYAGISLIAKVIFYFTIPISSVMFPLVIKRYNKKENVISLLLLSLALVLTPSLCITLFYFLFPGFVITLFLGGKGYLVAKPYVGLFGIYLSLFSAVNVFVNFLLSLSKMKTTYILTFGALAQILLLVLFHNSLLEFLLISMSILVVILVVLLVYYGKGYGAFKKSKEEKDFSYYSGI